MNHLFRPTSQAQRITSGCAFHLFLPETSLLACFFSVARRLQNIEFRVTGNPDRLPDETAVPPNVTLVGFLGPERFLSEMKESDVVVVLSTERESVMRTAYEAIRVGRPLVVSKTEATLKYFPYALHAEIPKPPLLPP